MGLSGPFILKSTLEISNANVTKLLESQKYQELISDGEIRQRWLLSWFPVSDACQPSPLESPRELDVFRFGLTMAFASLKLEWT